MIYQHFPRKKYLNCKLAEDKGFYVEGVTYNDCINQLKEYGEKHPEKWIYYHNCGYGPSHPVPICRNVLEVMIFDKQPAAPVLFTRLFQKGCDGKKEIDYMTKEEKDDLNKKQLMMLGMLGSSYKK